MRAAILNEQGSAPEPGEFDDPKASDGQAILEVLAAGLNPVDQIMASGQMGDVETPSVAGLEGIGRDEDGAHFYFDSSIDPYGSFAEKTLVQREELIEVPDGSEPILSVSYGIAGLAAWLGLDWRAELKEGERVLVLGASGVVGQIGIQAAKLLGAGSVVASARKQEELDLAAELGADAGVLTDGGLDEMREGLGGEAGDGFDVILDTLWGDPAVAALDHLAEGGRLVQIGNSAEPEATIPAQALRGVLGSIIGHMNFLAPREVKAEAFRRMCECGKSGELKVETEKFGIDSIGEAWEKQDNSPHHKLVVIP